MLGRRKRNRYKFTEKKQSKRGIAALVVAILIEIVYIVFLNAAFRGDGNLSMYYGSAGILMLGISLADFGFAIRSLFDEESFMTFPRLAVFFCTHSGNQLGRNVCCRLYNLAHIISIVR